MIVASSPSTKGYINDGNSLQNFTLNQLDVFQFTTVHDIQGMTVISDKPVTVISGTTCANIPPDVGSCDVITEQMIPFQALDNIYIVPPTPPKEAYELKVSHVNSSIIDSTCFYYSSKTFCTNASSMLMRIWNTPTVIVSKSIISVFQFGFGKTYPKVNIGDPFMTVIQGLKNFLNAYYFAIPSVYMNTSNHISVIIPKVNMDGLILDGSNLTAAPKDIFNVSAPLDNYTVLIMNVSFGFHHIYHINSNVKFGLQVYGLGEITNIAVGYGYPGGMQLSNFDEIPFSTMSPASPSTYVNSTHAATMSAASNSPNINSTNAVTMSDASNSPNINSTHAVTMSAASNSPNVNSTHAVTMSAASNSPYVNSTHAVTMSAASNSPNVYSTHAVTMSAASNSPNVNTTHAVTISAASNSPNVNSTHAATMAASSNSPIINSTNAENLQASSTAQSKTPSNYQSLASNQPTISSIIHTSVHFHTSTSTINGNTALQNDTNRTETFLHNSSSSTEGDSLGIILGSVFGIIAVLSTVACMLFFLLKRKKMRRSSVQPENEVNDEPSEMLEDQDNSEISPTNDTEGLGKGAENVD